MTRMLFAGLLLCQVLGCSQEQSKPKAEVTVNCHGFDQQTRYFCWQLDHQASGLADLEVQVKSITLDVDLRNFYKNKAVVGLTVLVRDGSWDGTMFIRINNKNLAGSATIVVDSVHDGLLLALRSSATRHK